MEAIVREKLAVFFNQSRDQKLLPIIFSALLSLSAAGAPAGAAVSMPAAAPTSIAQTAPPQFVPTDVTPFTVSPERNEFSPGFKFRLFQKLPERLWFNLTTEVSQRLDTNALFTFGTPKADYAFRALPNVTVGYNIFKNTSIYANYFVIKDVFARDLNNINAPTTQSLSWGIQHNKQLGAKTTLQFNLQARELWEAVHLHQFDFLPGTTLTHIINPNHIVYASTLLQLRGGEYFVAPTREIDPFYTVGYIYRRGPWTCMINDTLVTNFRHPPFNDAIPRESNVSMIADVEVNHPVSRRCPGLLAFVRAEPIWNWDSAKTPGISGFDFRLYTGLRLSISKPSYYAGADSLRKQIMQSASPATPSAALPSPTTTLPPSNQSPISIPPSNSSGGTGQTSNSN
jgi:hypothetical protein